MKKKELHHRRIRHLKLLGAGNSLGDIVQKLSQEFGCSEKSIYSDHSRIEEWSPLVGEEKSLLSEIKARLRLTNRRAIGLMLDDEVENSFVKVAAIHAVLKVTQSQIKLGQDLGLIKRAPIEVQNLWITTPLEADPVLRQAIIDSMEKQRAEKQALLESIEKQKVESDARKSSDAAGT